MKRQYGSSIRSVIHPTDFSHGSEIAFAHALRIVLGCKGQLEILHVDREQKRADWDNYPSVRDTLARWKLISPDASRSDVAKLGVDISKSASKGIDTAAGVLEHIDRRDADLVVMATHRREGLDRWMHHSLAERVANRTDAATLFVPYGVDGFVDLETGMSSLRRIVIPIDAVPDPQPAIDAASQLVAAVCEQPVEICLLHVGDPATMPSPTLPNNDNCRWVWETRAGNVVDCICDAPSDSKTDLIVMTTNGHDGFLDAIRGSTTERVLHRASCPVLSVHQPSDSYP